MDGMGGWQDGRERDIGVEGGRGSVRGLGNGETELAWAGIVDYAGGGGFGGWDVSCDGGTAVSERDRILYFTHWKPSPGFAFESEGVLDIRVGRVE